MSFLNPLYNALGYALAFFYSLIPNLGVAIILVTIATMILLYPLTAKQAKSMITMQRVQPEVKKLQAKYKGDRQKLNEEVMKFYQENKINPLAGCLPLVVQLPIFFVLFRVLRTPWEHVPKTGSFNQLYTKMCSPFGSLCGKATTKAQTVTLSSGIQRVIHPGTSTMHLIHLSFLGVDLTKTATDATLGFGGALPYYFLVLLVMLTGYLQTKQATARTPAANKQMGTVMKVLPVFFGVISLTFPAGLVLYFLVSNTWRLGQQELIFRRLGTGAAPAAGAAGKLGSPDKNGGALDVASTERANEAKAKAAADAARDGDPPPTSRARSATRPAQPPKTAPKAPPASRARSANPPAARRAPATRPAAQESGGGGLRGFFQLPPPPGGNGGGNRPGPSGSGSSGTKPAGSGGARRSGSSPPPRSRSKKKRKR